MNKFLYVAVVVLVAVSAYLIGSTNNSNDQSQETPEISPAVLDLETAIANYPRGGLDIPAQWFIMDTMVGAEKMMFIFGYADNKEVCGHLLNTAKEESPNRNFRCEDAN